MTYDGKERRQDSMSQTLLSHERWLADIDAQTKRLISHIESEQGTMARAHKHINDNIDQANKKLDGIDYIIRGNGKSEGLAGAVRRHDGILKVVIWSGGLVVVGCLGFAGWMVQQAFSKVFG